MWAAVNSPLIEQRTSLAPDRAARVGRGSGFGVGIGWRAPGCGPPGRILIVFEDAPAAPSMTMTKAMTTRGVNSW
jgi:hypothetical protein